MLLPRMCLRRWPLVTRSRYRRVMTMRHRRRHRTGIAAASAAFAVAVGAAVTSALAFAQPIEPARHTVSVVPPPPAAYSSSQTEAAKAAACTAWDRGARSTALASRASADALEQSWTSPESTAALATEKRTGMAAVSYLRTQMTDATPASTAIPMHEWTAANIDMLHALNMRHWDEAARALNRGNNVIDVITAECGLR